MTNTIDTKIAMRRILKSISTFAYLIDDETRELLRNLITNVYNKNNVDGLRAIVKVLNKISRTTGSSFELFTVNNGREYDFRETRF